MARPARPTRRRGEPPPPNPVTDIGNTFFRDEDGDGVNLDDVADMTAEEFTEFIDDNMQDFTESDLAALREFASSRASQGFGTEGNQWAQAAGALEIADTEGVDEGEEVLAENQATVDDQVLDDARADAIAEAAEVYGRTAPGVDPDFADVEALVPEGLDPNARERFLTDVIGEGREQAVAERAAEEQGRGASEEEAQQLAEGQIASDDLFGASEPDWLLQMNGGLLTDQQKDRYVDYWNSAYGEFFTDFDTELAPILRDRFDGSEREAQDFANNVLAAQEPLISHSIELPFASGTRTATYTDEQYAALRAMGYSNAAITRLARLSAFADGPEGFDSGSQTITTSNFRAFASLARYYGAVDELDAFTESQGEIAELEQQMGLRPGEFGRMTFQERTKMLDEWKAGQASAEALRGEGESTPFDARIEAWEAAEQMLRQQGRSESRPGTVGLLAARNNFTRGMEQYRGDELLALVHAVDPNLAQRVAATGGDAEKLDWEDNEAVYGILERAGAIGAGGVAVQQLQSSTNLFGFFETGGGSGGGAGPVRRVIDPELVREQVQQLWSRMFLSDVDDATVAAITANLQKQLDEAPEGMTVDATSRIMAFLRGQDVYDELYRNKPEGLSEEEYQGQFAAGIADMVGNELDPEALKSGMRTGDYQTALGRAASTDKLLTNSTLRGRWAQAKQTLDRFS